MATTVGKKPNAKQAWLPIVGCQSENDANDLNQAIKDALSSLGKEDLSLIVHGSSFPSLPGWDTGFGSPYGEAAKQLISYLKTFGFNSIQLGPGGKTKFIDSSPYVSTTFSGNPLFIDLHQLVEESLLKECTVESICHNNPSLEEAGQKHRTAYEYIYQQQADALKQAYGNFEKLNDTKLKTEFEKFCKSNQHWLENDALYEALSEIHQNDYWPNWSSDLDKRLLNPHSESEQQQAKTRVEEIQKSQKGIIQQYKFEQWLLDRQKKSFLSWVKEQGVLLIADRQVGFSERDVWAYQTLFLQGWSLGAPPDYFSKDGQAWAMPMLNPELIFNEDGSLGPAGDFLKAIFDKTFSENPGGVRIDHIIGLIDPWVYPTKKHPKAEDGAGRLFSSPEHPDLAKFSKINGEQLNHSFESFHEERVQHLSDDNVKHYGQMIQLVLDCAKTHAVPLNSIICEDLGTLTAPVKAVLENFALSGIRVTQFVEPEKDDHLYRGKNSAEKHWMMAGSHDNEPLYRWIKGLYSENRQHSHVAQLKQDLQSHGSLASTFELPFGTMPHDSKAFLLAKYAELFASPSKHIQIFFSDFFGIDGLYNRPGRGGKKNWSLRVPNDYNTYYAEQLARQAALNLPLVLHLAMASRLPAQASEQDLKQLDKLAKWGHKLQTA